MATRAGFTMVEVLVAFVVGVILLSTVVEGMDGFRTPSAVRQARHLFLSMHAETRMQAQQSGQTTELNVDSDGDSIWISRNDSTLSVAQLGSDMGVDIGGKGVAKVCITPRGFADASCNSFGQGSMTVRFVQGRRASTVSVLALGQALY